jgi:hypothetical protein
MQRDDWIKLGVAGLATSALGFAAATMAMGGSAKTAKEPNIYYKSQAAADKALQKFDTENPDCQLWTNWQKMCSRTGADGSTLCKTDPEVSVSPSTVFCSRSGDSSLSLENNTLTSQQLSRDRFCTTFEYKSPLSKRLGRPICVDLDPKRPFSGYRISSRMHPWCSKWKDKTSLLEPKNDKFNSTSGFYCSEPRTPSWCKYPEGFGEIPINSPDHPKYGTGEILVLGTIDEAMHSRVVGISCRKNK